MRRDDTVRRIPQLALLRQGFRVRHIQRRAPQPRSPLPALRIHQTFRRSRWGIRARRIRVRICGGLVGGGVRFQRGDELVLDEDLAARYIGYESVFLGEDVEFGFP